MDSAGLPATWHHQIQTWHHGSYQSDCTGFSQSLAATQSAASASGFHGQAGYHRSDPLVPPHSSQTKAWTCGKCNASYAYPYDLTRHVRERHMDRPRFRCHVCGMGFTFKDHYTGHMNSHNKIKGFHCQHCPRKFTYKSDLYKHRKKCKAALWRRRATG